MKIVMKVERVFQDVGQQRLLRIGEVADLPDTVARALVATGAATMSTPERKPAAPPETK